MFRGLYKKEVIKNVKAVFSERILIWVVVGTRLSARFSWSCMCNRAFGSISATYFQFYWKHTSIFLAEKYTFLRKIQSKSFGLVL